MKNYKELLKEELMNNLESDLKFDTNKLEDNKVKRPTRRGKVSILIGTLSFSLCATFCFVTISMFMIPVILFGQVKENPRMYEKTYKQSELNAIEEGSFVKLNEVDYPSLERDYKEVDEEYKNAVNNFAYDVFTESINENQNYIVSPLSLYSLLDILSSGSSNPSTASLFDDVLNLSYDIRKDNYAEMYENNYYVNENGTIQMYNGVFLNNRYSYNEEFVDDLSFRYVEAYQLDFSNDSDVNKMVDWANDKVQENDFISYRDLDINEETEMYAFSTLYFNNKWSNQYSKRDNYKDYFYLKDGNKKRVTYMTHSYQGIVYDYDNFYSFYDYYKNGSKIKYIFPKEDKHDVFSLVNDINFLIDDENYLVQSGHWNGYVLIDLTLPKFTYDYSIDFNGILSNIGLVDLFDENINSFDKVFKDYPSDINFYLQKVMQKNKVSFTEDGTEVRTITVAGMGANSAGPIQTLSIKLNRPFIYVIYDNNNLPLYIGSVVNP